MKFLMLTLLTSFSLAASELPSSCRPKSTTIKIDKVISATQITSQVYYPPSCVGFRLPNGGNDCSIANFPANCHTASVDITVKDESFAQISFNDQEQLCNYFIDKVKKDPANKIPEGAELSCDFSESIIQRGHTPQCSPNVDAVSVYVKRTKTEDEELNSRCAAMKSCLGSGELNFFQKREARRALQDLGCK
jgi:hypothetical protein